MGLSCHSELTLVKHSSAYCCSRKGLTLHPAVVQDMRIDFQFDRAAFDLKLLPFKVPYPVPFKLLGDETKVSPS
jgi:hypothetical protein